MTKKIQEIALAFFLVVCGVSVIVGVLWLKPVVESHKALIEETKANQAQIMQNAKEARAIVTEVGYAVTVLAMLENRMIQPADANKMIDEAVTNIDAQSKRLGKLAKLINDYRINKQGRRRY